MAARFAANKQINSKKAETAFKELLDRIESNEDGRYILEDFVQALEDHGCEVDGDTLAKIWETADGRGSVSRTDLLQQTRHTGLWKNCLEAKTAKADIVRKATMRSQGREDTASIAFRLFDTDHDGFVTKEEFTQVSKTLSPSQIKAVFEKFDSNQDGRLSKKEFKKLMGRE